TFGSSHEYLGINPQYWDCDGFNFALYSQDLYYDRKLLSDYLDRMNNLELVILPISYLTLEYKLEKSPEEWRRFFYLRYLGLPRQSNFELNDLLRDYSLIALHAPRRVPKYAVTGFDKVSGFAENFDENGWYGIKGTNFANINEEAGKERVALHHKLMNPAYTPE